MSVVGVAGFGYAGVAARILWELSPSSMQGIQILGAAEGHLFATQIGALQPAHRRRTDGTLGVGMLATR